MKKFQVLAGIVSAVALSGGIAFADPASAYTCSFGKSKAAQSGSGTTLVGSGGSDSANPWQSSCFYKAAALGFLGLAGALGGGAAYMSYRAGKKAKAACDAMSDNFEVFEETVEPTAAAVSEPAEVPAAIDLAAGAVVEPSAPVAEAVATVTVVREHPEAPGGELDLPAVEVGDVIPGSAIAK
jgi:hypothetical protein